MKSKTLFLIINVLLVLVVLLCFGIAGKDWVFSNPTSISSFVVLLVALCLPSVFYLLKDVMGPGGRVASVLVLLAEVGISILFLCKPEFGLSAFWITEAVVLGVYLASLLVIIALTRSDAPANP